MLDDAARERGAARLPRQRARSCASGSAGQRSSALRRDSAASCGNRRTQPLSRRPGSFPVQMRVQEQVSEQMAPAGVRRRALRAVPRRKPAGPPGPLSARPGGRRRPRWRSLGLALLPAPGSGSSASRPARGWAPAPCLPPPVSALRGAGWVPLHLKSAWEGGVTPMKASTAPLDLDPRPGSGGGGVGLVQGKPAGGARPSTRAGQQGRCRLEAPGGAGGRGSASLTHTRCGGSQVRPTSEFRSRRGARPALQGKDFQTTHVSPVAPQCPGGSQAHLRPRRHRAAPRACLPVPGRHGGSRCPAGRRGLGAPDQPVPGRRAWGLELSLSAEPDPLGCWQPATRRKPTCRKRAGKPRGPCGHSRPRVSCRPRLSPAPLGLRGSWRPPPNPNASSRGPVRLQSAPSSLQTSESH